ncbi:MAG: ATP-binding protein [Defluviitaleaceae bacterium]|nr:ATP-binding protein [Defluviitaleaceae bacterium]MCL2273687.1 ATP-binding protein [Defluviitaleaceae bacterium]
MKNLNRTTRLTLFSTILITIVMFILQLFIVANAPPAIPMLGVVIALPVTVLLAYVVSAIVIDRAMNPIRLMIERIRSMGSLEFKPLIAYDEGEDIREYAAAFNQMAHRLNSYIERQKRFISDASHELATPITVINGHADMLIRRGADPTMLERSLSIIKTEALRMNDLVESLLLLARSDSGKQPYSFTTTRVNTLLEETINETRLIVPNFTFSLEIPETLTAVCDENSIRRVLRILLSNAVKYGNEDAGQIGICASMSHGLVHIIVRDNGMGIPAEHLPRIFERFYRVDPSRTQKTGSSGLGLAIAREIITAHGGEITVESEVGQGTAFGFALQGEQV